MPKLGINIYIYALSGVKTPIYMPFFITLFIRRPGDEVHHTIPLEKLS
tara:strand:- start:166 stop:309 length:144 start_codon:yes stop_codon:yes gene_type:complete